MKESTVILFLAAATSLLALIAADTLVYFPTDDITVNCGYSGNSNRMGDPRDWIGDVDNRKYAPKSADGNDGEIISAAPFPMGLGVPYDSARLSASPFAYTFHLTPGPKFVRLYFFPSNYLGQNFSRSDALFSVTAGSYTLLKDFSPSLSADYRHNGPSFQDEFVVCIGKNQVLNLTFLPSATVPRAYAFVNGIEVVSMPDDLYYTNMGASDGLASTGQSTTIVIRNYDALEMVKRVNVGGRDIPPRNDTGMFRSWEQDEQYLLVRNWATDYGVIPINPNIQLTYSSQTPDYTAPDCIYKTARSMGGDNFTNLGNNLTWLFGVDSNFYYLVRLHFCEFQREITQPTDRVFQIFIDSKTAEAHADIMGWSGKGMPVYKDYVVAMFDGQSKRMNLTIALHPYGGVDTNYSDVILNGIEIFKINSTSGSLAGPDPDLAGQGTEPLAPSTKHSSGGDLSRMIGGVMAGAISCLGIISLLVLFIYRARKVSKRHGHGRWGDFSLGPLIMR